jgi:hypothetical protein
MQNGKEKNLGNLMKIYQIHWIFYAGRIPPLSFKELEKKQ